MADKNVALPDGSVVAFPDTMSDGDIGGAIQRHLQSSVTPALTVGAPPTRPQLAKTMDSGEGPIAQGMTTMERRLTEMRPSAPAAAGAGSYGSAISLAHPEMAATPQSPRALNPIATNEGSLPMNIGATAANLLPLAIDPGMEGIASSPIGKIMQGASAIRQSLLPTPQEAGQAFGFEKNLSQTPTSISDPRAIGQQAMDLHAVQGGAPTVLKNYMSRTAPTEPGFPAPNEPAPSLLYPESRLFQTGAGRLSTTERLAANPQMQRLVGQFADALKTSNRQAADSLGLGDEFDTAMKTYSRAKRIENAMDVAKQAITNKFVQGAGIGAGAALLGKMMEKK